DAIAWGRVELPAPLAGDMGRYKLHPALLDACFQIVIAALPASMQDETWLPVGLKRFQLYQPAPAELWCRVAILQDEQGLLADLALFDTAGTAVAVVEALRARQANPALLGARPAVVDLESWLYGLDWQTQSLWHPPYSAARLAPPAPSELDALMADMTCHYQVDECGVGLDALDALCVDYVIAAFAELGQTFRPGERFTSAALADRLVVVDAHRNLLHRMLEMLAEENLLRQDADGWEVLETPKPRDIPAALAVLSAGHPRIAAELDLTRRCAEALARVLRGACDPLQELLFPGGDGSALAALYRDTPGAQAVSVVLRQALLSVVNSLPSCAGLRILEIGGGTGGASSALLPHLPAGRSEYVFTDISAAFTRQAQDTFAAYPFIRYATLDIEKDPAAQGFEAQAYDIVVASNVLHATVDLAATLRHVTACWPPAACCCCWKAPRRNTGWIWCSA
ncbi:MAG: polyketide synthase dehydratase domain-containing protein, partial [Candidatus Methylumidiphilus sp.]